MLGYVGHNGVVDRHHPVMERVRDANSLFSVALLQYDRDVKPATWQAQLAQAKPLSGMHSKRAMERAQRAMGLKRKRPTK